MESAASVGVAMLAAGTLHCDPHGAHRLQSEGQRIVHSRPLEAAWSLNVLWSSLALDQALEWRESGGCLESESAVEQPRTRAVPGAKQLKVCVQYTAAGAAYIKQRPPGAHRLWLDGRVLK